MNIKKISDNSLTFTRALTSEEKKNYKKLTSDARAELNTKETSAIVFDFNIPAQYGMNCGIGTSNSSSTGPFIEFLKDFSSISKIQFGPQSELAYYSDGKNFYPTTSPYSGSTFGFGRHTISIEKLAGDEFANILDISYVKSLDENYPNDKIAREYKTDYGYTLGLNKDGIIFEALKKAYDNFNSRINANDPAIKPLKDEFEQFKLTSPDYIFNDAIFDALTDIYHKKGQKGADYTNWDYTDKYLMTDKVSDNDRNRRIEELKPDIEFNLFVQFLAQKQHDITKKELNDKGIKIFGDCLVCFSPKEVWSNPDCFLNGWYTGGIDPNCPETNNIQPWGSPALDYDRLGQFDENTGEIIRLDKTGKLLYEKFKTFMKNYDGVRMDAFWQYVSPFIYSDNLEGKNVQNIDTKIIQIMKKAANDVKKEGFNPDDFVLELIGFNTEYGKKLTKNIFPHVYSTAYAEYNENPKDLIEVQGYNDGKFIIGATSHDNDSLVNMSRNPHSRNIHENILKNSLKRGYEHLGYGTDNYNSMDETKKAEENYRTAKAAEIFTTQRQYYTLPDMFGMQERINISGKSDDNNWSVRIPNDYERFYYSQLQNGYGINFPKSYALALMAKNSGNEKLISSLLNAADILRQNGPATEQEANEADKRGELKNKLDYKA